MDLDFSGLMNLKPQDQEPEELMKKVPAIFHAIEFDSATGPAEVPDYHMIDYRDIPVEKPQRSRNKASGTKKPDPFTKQRANEEQYKKELAAMAEKIKNSEKVKTEITIGIQKGAPLEDLFIKALECIADLSGDEVFRNLNTNAARAVYGPNQYEIPL